jgi:hypothetical protein
VVFIGPFEHHSNELPWRESAAEVVAIAEDSGGHLDLRHLERELVRHAGRPLRIGSFSAASNVTELLTDTGAVADAAGRLAGRRVANDSRSGADRMGHRGDDRLPIEAGRSEDVEAVDDRLGEGVSAPADRVAEPHVDRHVGVGHADVVPLHVGPDVVGAPSPLVRTVPTPMLSIVMWNCTW